MTAKYTVPTRKEMIAARQPTTSKGRGKFTLNLIAHFTTSSNFLHSSISPKFCSRFDFNPSLSQIFKL